MDKDNSKIFINADVVFCRVEAGAGAGAGARAGVGCVR